MHRSPQQKKGHHCATGWGVPVSHLPAAPKRCPRWPVASTNVWPSIRSRSCVFRPIRHSWPWRQGSFIRRWNRSKLGDKSFYTLQHIGGESESFGREFWCFLFWSSGDMTYYREYFQLSRNEDFHPHMKNFPVIWALCRDIVFRESTQTWPDQPRSTPQGCHENHQDYEPFVAGNPNRTNLQWLWLFSAGVFGSKDIVICPQKIQLPLGKSMCCQGATLDFTVSDLNLIDLDLDAGQGP